MTRTDEREIAWRVDPAHPAFDGHFPGRPLLPGVALLAQVLETLLDQPGADERLGPAPTLGNVKFLAPVAPGVALRIVLADAADGGVRFDVRAGDRPVASGRFEAAR